MRISLKLYNVVCYHGRTVKTEILLPYLKGVPRHFDKHRFPTAADHVHYHVLWLYSDPIECHHQRRYASDIDYPFLVRDAGDHDYLV